MITTLAFIVIFCWAVWCVFSEQVKDGILGKLAYAGIAISAMVAFLPGSKATHGTATFTLVICLALIGARHFIMKMWKQHREKPL